MLPLELPPLLEKNGFGSLTRTNISFLDTALHAGTTAYYLSKLIANLRLPGVSEEDANLWLSQLSDAIKKVALVLLISLFCVLQRRFENFQPSPVKSENNLI